MDDKLRDAIAANDVILLVLPATGIEGTEGEEHLRLAMELGKHIIVWVPDDRPSGPLPPSLRGYADHVVVNGDEHAAFEVVKQFMELLPGQTLTATDWAYPGREEEG